MNSPYVALLAYYVYLRCAVAYPSICNESGELPFEHATSCVNMLWFVVSASDVQDVEIVVLMRENSVLIRSRSSVGL